jgi:hypothetical protein
MSRTNYLNNRDMLKEIHLSKNSYCTFVDPVRDHQFDLILHKIGDVGKRKTVSEARANRIERIRKETGEEVSARSIPVTDLVFRVMTWQHIPLAPPRPARPTRASKVKKLMEEIEPVLEETDDEADQLVMTAPDPTHVRVNFPPFQHYRLTEDLEPVCVGKSHWRGDLNSGEFSKTHGQMTDTLALMFMKLCERYATRSNWRGYTYNDEMRGAALLQLSQIGLQFDESKSSNPFSYYTAALTNSFTRILNIEKKNQAIRDDILEANGLTPSFTRQMSWRQEQ